jgi:hypothetical protein
VVITVTALVTMGFSFDDKLECMNLDHVRKGRPIRRQEWLWLSYGQIVDVVFSVSRLQPRRDNSRMVTRKVSFE